MEKLTDHQSRALESLKGKFGSNEFTLLEYLSASAELKINNPDETIRRLNEKGAVKRIQIAPGMVLWKIVV